MARKKTSADEKRQSERFEAAARDLECDESEESFDETLAKVARPKALNEAQAPGSSTKQGPR